MRQERHDHYQTAVWFLSLDDRYQRILDRHVSLPDGQCAGCFPCSVRFELCTVRAMAEEARRLDAARPRIPLPREAAPIEGPGVLVIEDAPRSAGTVHAAWEARVRAQAKAKRAVAS